MNLIDHHPPHMREVIEPFFLAEQNAETFRRRQQDMRWPGELPGALRGARITGAERHSNRGFSRMKELGQRFVEVLLQIVAEGPERRDVDTMNTFLQRAEPRLFDQRVEDGEKRGKRFSRTGR
jgi:hypothetical protein